MAHNITGLSLDNTPWHGCTTIMVCQNTISFNVSKKPVSFEVFSEFNGISETYGLVKGTSKATAFAFCANLPEGTRFSLWKRVGKRGKWTCELEGVS